MMSKLGGGTSGYFETSDTEVRQFKKRKSFWSVHIMQLLETMVDVVSQGSVRRGRFSLIYL